MKNTTIILAILAVIALGVLGFFIFNQTSQDNMRGQNQDIENNFEESDSDEEENQEGAENDNQSFSIIGQSVSGRDIESYTYGSGEEHLLFVGGIHGGYSWNTALVAFELIDYLEENLDTLSENVKVTVIPVLNPDGLNKIVGTSGRFSSSDVPPQDQTIQGRFNANEVDLNRNFDCKWQSSGTWQDRKVSGGSSPFSEPESQAFRDFVRSNNISATVVWYSAVGGVFASNCENGVLPETLEITNLYADASGYPAYEEFDFYEITGDMVNWLAKEEIPGISVLLTNHQDTEWQKNLNGIQALISHYSQ